LRETFFRDEPLYYSWCRRRETTLAFGQLKTNKKTFQFILVATIGNAGTAAIATNLALGVMISVRPLRTAVPHQNIRMVMWVQKIHWVNCVLSHIFFKRCRTRRLSRYRPQKARPTLEKGAKILLRFMHASSPYQQAAYESLYSQEKSVEKGILF